MMDINSIPLPPNEDNYEILKLCLEKAHALSEVAWECADKFKDLENAVRFNYFLALNGEIERALKALEGVANDLNTLEIN